jgi:hypothetical protein
MRLPREVRDRVKEDLWRQADELDWDSLGSAEKARLYRDWTEAETIGRTLAMHMDPRAVRVYIKDTLLKAYSREKLNGHQGLVLRVLERATEDIRESHIKPHWLRFADGVLVAWGRADDWKLILGSLFERGYPEDHRQRVVVLFKAAPRYVGSGARSLVEDAARRLGTSRCVWFD